MKPIRLIRRVDAPDGHGPGNGQYALQKLLRAAAPPWLAIGGDLEPGEVPWVWSWEDAWIAVRAAVRGEPFLCGPNVLFADSRDPCGRAEERYICEAASCRLLFTESAWYADLIRSQLGPHNTAAIVTWPYPIDPLPEGPLEPEYDLLIYSKSGHRRQLLRELGQAFPRSRILVYGRYRREDLVEAARRSRCCAYLSDDDRGPLALAEVLLAGCPAVGLPRGAPWIDPGANGRYVDALTAPAIAAGIRASADLDRRQVRARALARFDGRATIAAIVAAIEALAPRRPAGLGEKDWRVAMEDTPYPHGQTPAR
jgi:hypothetical protein